MLAAAILIAMLAWAAPASAHATLLSADPAAGGSVPAPPHTLSLTFNEPVTLPDNAVILTASGGSSIPLGPPTRSHGEAEVTVTVGSRLPVGIYTVTWQVISEDGDAVTGSYQFGVGPVPAGGLSSGATGSTATAGQPATALLRWLVFAALALLLGAAVVRRILRRHPSLPPDAGWRFWTCAAGALGAVASLGLAAIIARSGSLGAGLTHPDLGLLNSTPGRVPLLEAAAFTLAAVTPPRLLRYSWVAMLAVIAGEGVRAHPGNYAHGWGVLLTVIHLTAAAVWVGALAHVIRLVFRWRARPGRGWVLLASYARLAGWLFAAALVTGTLSALVVVPARELLVSGYGQILLAKIALVVVAAALALAARIRLRRRITGAGDTGFPMRTMRVEASLLAVVLAVTAILTTVAPPRATASTESLPPQNRGPVVPIGTRAGQIGVSVAASSGQVIVQLFAPGAEPGETAAAASQDGARQTQYRLAATVADPTGPATRQLRFRGCGTGCFLAPHTWQSGVNQLSLRVDASGWHGGDITVPVPWPPHPEPALLRSLTDEVHGAATLTFYEQVTSDTTTGLGPRQKITISGARYLSAVEPYTGGQATITNSRQNPDGTTTLLLSYPTQGINVGLTLAHVGRLLTESETDPDHLITRTFVYPEH